MVHSLLRRAAVVIDTFSTAEQRPCRAAKSAAAQWNSAGVCPAAASESLISNVLSIRSYHKPQNLFACVLSTRSRIPTTAGKPCDTSELANGPERDPPPAACCALSQQFKVMSHTSS